VGIPPVTVLSLQCENCGFQPSQGFFFVLVKLPFLTPFNTLKNRRIICKSVWLLPATLGICSQIPSVVGLTNSHIIAGLFQVR
jgi:hypothetical protein